MYKIPILPLKEDLESKAVLRQVARSHRRLAELKGAVRGVKRCRLVHSQTRYLDKYPFLARG